MKSYLANPQSVDPKWYIVDAEGKTLGRLAVQIANVLRGRNRPTYTPHVDTGDYVVVINAAKVKVTGKKETQKTYMFFSGWRGNEKYITLEQMRERKPEFIIEHAVKGMLPRNKLANAMLKKLRIFNGPEHTHEAQQPQPLEV